MQVSFYKPLSVSIGEKPDKLVVDFVKPELFISKASGKSLPEDSEIDASIPKQFPDLETYEIAQVAGSTVQFAATSAFLTQFAVTITLAVSLKAMWNLMHVMQVIAYLRLLVLWPANGHMILQSIHNSITLENLINGVYASFNPDFEEQPDENQEELIRNDIQHENIWLSLGIFGIAIAALLMILMFYGVV